MDNSTTKTIRLDGCTLIITRPELTEAERRKAEQKIRDALKGYGKGQKHES